MAMRPLRIVIAGGGIAALETALGVRALAPDLSDVTLVAPGQTFSYRVAAVGEPFGASSVHRFDLARIARDIGVGLRRGAIASVRAEERQPTLGDGETIAYDALVIACGAEARPAIPGALTFAGPGDVASMRDLLAEIGSGRVLLVALAIPASIGWTLPAYELALLLSHHAGARLSVSIVSPESEPLAAFGGDASAAVRSLLERRGIALHLNLTPVKAVGGALRTRPHRDVPADRVVALPRLFGVPIDGVPATRAGLLRTDEHGRVERLADVYAAGDITAFPVKQGGIAAEQADAVAQALAAEAGADVHPEPFRPVLRGRLVTGDGDRFLRADIGGGRGDTAKTSLGPMWWPPVKTHGRYLAPYLARIDAAALTTS